MTLWKTTVVFLALGSDIGLRMWGGVSTESGAKLGKYLGNGNETGKITPSPGTVIACYIPKI